MSTDLWPTDAWTESRPEDQRVDPEKLLEAARFLSQHRHNVYSLLLVKNGRLVFERYFQDTGPATLHRVASATKSVLSILVGIALEQGRIPTIDQKITDYFPEAEHTLKNTVKEFLTLRRLLLMKEGLLFSEDFEAWEKRRNNTQFVLDLPNIQEPDENFRYAAAPHVVSRILTLATGMNAAEFAEARLFRPLGIRSYEWPVDSTGTAWGSGGLRLTSRDMAKLGYLYLKGGTWEGRRIVSPEWVRESTTNHKPAGPPYGYYWWLGTLGGCPYYGAVGFGGQYIFVFPDLDLVLVTTAEVGGPGTGGIVEKYILPAVLRS
jgi:CubicO group peptidase (beta-lactamase class C family)